MTTPIIATSIPAAPTTVQPTRGRARQVVIVAGLVAAIAAGCSADNAAQQREHTTVPTMGAPTAGGQTAADPPDICANSEPRACYFRGMKLEAASKPGRALAYFKAACDDGVMSACYDLGVLYETGDAVDADIARAKTLYQKACRADDADGVACNNLAVMYQRGRGVQADQTKAAQLFEAGCKAGSMLSCRNLGRRYLHGEGVRQSPRRAADLLDKACTAGHPKACPELTYLYAQSCLQNDACAGDPDDRRSTAAKLRQKCQQDHQPQSCLGHGFILESGVGADQKPAPAKAALAYDQACQGGVAAGCNFLANLYRKGRGVQRQTKRAVQLYNKACSQGFTLSCHTLGVMHLRGRSLPPDPKRGFDYIQQACQGGRTPSCTALEFQCFLGRKQACH